MRPEDSLNIKQQLRQAYESYFKGGVGDVPQSLLIETLEYIEALEASACAKHCIKPPLDTVEVCRWYNDHQRDKNDA